MPPGYYIVPLVLNLIPMDPMNELGHIFNKYKVILESYSMEKTSILGYYNWRQFIKVQEQEFNTAIDQKCIELKEAFPKIYVETLLKEGEAFKKKFRSIYERMDEGLIPRL